MQRTYVESSNLYSVGYDPRSEILEVEFHGGRIYRYFDVPPSLYTGLMQASSHGKYFNQHIKQGGFAYTRVN